MFSEQWSTDTSPVGNTQSTTFIVASGLGRITLIWHILPPHSPSAPIPAYGYERTDYRYLNGFPQTPVTPQEHEQRGSVPGVSFYSRKPLMVPQHKTQAFPGPFGPSLPAALPPTSVPAIQVVGSQGGSSLTLSYWLLTLASAALPVSWLVGWRRRFRRHQLGLCLTCGYDLTGNSSGICFECGNGIPKLQS